MDLLSAANTFKVLTGKTIEEIWEEDDQYRCNLTDGSKCVLAKVIVERFSTLVDKTRTETKEVYRLQNVVEEQEKALLHWRREYDALFEENNVLHNEVKRLLAEYTKLHEAYEVTRQYVDTPQGRCELAMRIDSDAWDFVEEQGKAGPWVARYSTTGRGFRLHTTSDPYAWVDGENPVGMGETAREAVLDLYKKTEGW